MVVVLAGVVCVSVCKLRCVFLCVVDYVSYVVAEACWVFLCLCCYLPLVTPCYVVLVAACDVCTAIVWDLIYLGFRFHAPTAQGFGPGSKNCRKICFPKMSKIHFPGLGTLR